MLLLVKNYTYAGRLGISLKNGAANEAGGLSYQTRRSPMPTSLLMHGLSFAVAGDWNVAPAVL
eukprot:2384848-Pyramimonas_sp.AAC.1